MQGLVQLGFILMDTYGPKAAFGRIDLVPGLQSGPTHQACQLGAKILLNTFKVKNYMHGQGQKTYKHNSSDMPNSSTCLFYLFNFNKPENGM